MARQRQAADSQHRDRINPQQLIVASAQDPQRAMTEDQAHRGPRESDPARHPQLRRTEAQQARRLGGRLHGHNHQEPMIMLRVAVRPSWFSRG